MATAQVERYRLMQRIASTGLTLSDAQSLCHIAKTLHGWYEMESESVTKYYSFYIERDVDAPGNLPYMVRTDNRTGQVIRCRTVDREASALRRLDKVMARYPSLSYYIQSDPRGHSLYILRPSDVPEGRLAEDYYSRGVAIY